MAAQKTADLQLVLSAVQDFPGSVGQMLVAGLPHAVGPSAAQRHAYQAEIIALALDRLRQSSQAAEGEKAAIAAKLTEEQAQMAALEERCSEAGAGVAAAAAVVKERSAAHAAARTQVQRAESSHAEVESLKVKVDQHQASLQSRCERVAFVHEGPLSMLRKGGWEDEEARLEAVDAVLGVLREAGAEDTVLAAVPAALKVGPDARRAFDKVVEHNVADVVSRHLSHLQTEVAQVSENAEQTSAETLGLWAIADMARDATAVAQDALLAAKAALEESKRHRAESDQERARHEEDVSTLAASKPAADEAASKLVAAVEAASRLQADEYEDPSSQPPQAMDVDLEAGTSCAAEANAGGATSDAQPMVVA